MNSQNKITELLNGLLTAHGLNDEKLSHLTNIPKRFISALRTGDLSNLPAEPYTRGYLIKIAATLKTDPTELVSAYKESVPQKRRNGSSHKLPINRYEQIPLDKKWLFAGIIVVLLATFFFFRLDAILGIPELDVYVPEQTYEEVLTVEGHVKPRDTLTLNGEIVYTDDAGNFKRDVLLQPGINTLDFRVKRFLGREVEIIKTVHYNVAPEPVILETTPTL